MIKWFKSKKALILELKNEKEKLNNANKVVFAQMVEIERLIKQNSRIFIVLRLYKKLTKNK